MGRYGSFDANVMFLLLSLEALRSASFDVVGFTFAGR